MRAVANSDSLLYDEEFQTYKTAYPDKVPLYTLHPIYTLYPITHTLYHTLCPIPYTCTLHPIPSTQYPVTDTLHPLILKLRLGCGLP
jgi:hypothetical protein